MIELAMPIAFCWLYWFQTQAGGLLLEQFRFPAFLSGYESTATKVFATHAILVVLMTAATFIDFDEQTIPDAITIPGTILALVLASISPGYFLPTSMIDGAALQVVPTTFDSPWFQPGRWMEIDGLWVGLAIWSLWCFALADWRWSSAVARRRGIRRAVNHFVNGLFHYGYWRLLAMIWVLGVVGIVWVWNVHGSSWLGLFSALLGLAVGGGVIWSIRIVASWALHMEAMGFGDVTLMAMIGSFLGWQAAVLAFFLSPFAAIVIVLVRFVITRDTYTPFGPYLCAATIWTILWWDRLYRGWFAEHLLLMGPVLLWLSAMMLGLMAVMLFVWRHIKARLFS
jgi:prepilin signal peptidase PulO-like enzyme (type II secretory pathway)